MPPFQLVSVTVQEFRERLLILCLSLKGTGTDSAGELTLRSGSVGEVTTLGEDLLSVGVGSGFVHTSMMAHPGRSRSSRGYKTPKENLKVACANLATGRAAAILNKRSS